MTRYNDLTWGLYYVVIRFSEQILSKMAGFGQFWAHFCTFLSLKWPKVTQKAINVHYWSILNQEIWSDHNIWWSSTRYINLKIIENRGIFNKSGENPQNLKTAVKNFPQTFGSGIGAHFFYFSTQNTNQVRKKPYEKAVTELRFLTQLWFVLQG